MAPKSDDCVILALAAQRGDTSFSVGVRVMQVRPARRTQRVSADNETDLTRVLHLPRWPVETADAASVPLTHEF